MKKNLVKLFLLILAASFLTGMAKKPQDKSSNYCPAMKMDNCPMMNQPQAQVPNSSTGMPGQGQMEEDSLGVMTGSGQQISGAGESSSEDLDRLLSSLGIQKVGEDVEAPDFELENLEGKKVSLSDYRGKVVLLNFMATWCHWCRKEMPSLQKLYDQFRDKGFVIVAVFSDREGARVVVPFIEKSGYTFSVSSGLLDPSGRVTSMYRVTGTPTAYLIDREGKIIGWEVGYRDWFTSGARGLIKKLLAAD